MANTQETDSGDLFSKPLQIRETTIVGNGRTHHSVVERELQDAYHATTVREVSEGLAKGIQALNRLDIFESVGVECDAVADDPTQTDVKITVVEKGFVKLKAETFVQGGESGVETSLTLRNALGSAEMVDATFGYGYGHSKSTHINFRKPRFMGVPMMFNTAIYNDLFNRSFHSSMNEKIRGVNTFFSTYDGMHRFGVTADWRDIVPIRLGDSHDSEDSKSSLDPYAYASSSDILQQAHPSIKTSLSYTINIDRRDDPMVPKKGGLIRLTTELAGLGGDVSFNKTQFHFQRFRTLFGDDFTFGFGFKCGFLYPISNSLYSSSSWRSRSDSMSSADPNAGEDANATSLISDRFFLGGPLQFRGFQHAGVGPRSKQGGTAKGDALGGDVTWSLGTQLNMDLFPQFGIAATAFMNVGNLVSHEHANIRTLVRGARASAGIGLILPTPVGRLEATYSHILRANSRDQVKRFQLGLGAEFL